MVLHNGFRRPRPARRPDWENVVSQVLDWLLDRPEVDPARVSLLAPRAAAFEHRLAAMATAPFPGTATEAVLRAKCAPQVDAAIEAMMASDPTMRWAVTHGSYAMGATTPRAFVASYLDYTLADGIAEKITCPTLVCDAEEDLFFDGQPEQLYDHLTCPKELPRFTTAEGAGARIATVAPSARPSPASTTSSTAS